MRDISTVYMWVNDGCDIQKDIVPAMTEAMKRKKGINAFSYFTNMVCAARDKRLLAPKIKQPVRMTDEQIAQTYAWRRDKGLYLSPHEERFLKQWEDKNGMEA